MKRVGIFAWLCLSAAMVWAAPVDGKKAARVARNFWMAKSGQKEMPTLVDCSAQWQYNAIYLFTHPEGGFVMVSGDDRAMPVLGYSLSSPFSPDRLPANLRWWLEGYQRQLEWVRAHDGKSSPSVAEQWRSLLDGSFRCDGKEAVVGPLLSTTWSQDAPFNDLCPGEGDNKAVVGCAATAQAMLMKYWNFPPIGFGSSSYVSTRYGRQSADYGHTIYDWEHMVDNPTLASTAEERHAVAELMYHIGVSIEMMYGSSADGGSGALGVVGLPGYASIDNSLKDYFHYSDQMRVVDRADFNSAAWLELLIEDLDKRHPILYTGADPEGGHAFICDGYDHQRYLHFNFGWRGVGDGFYSVDSISPLQGGVGGNGSYTFNMANMALLNAVPDYGILVGSDLLYFDREGVADSVLFSADVLTDDSLYVSCDASWVRIRRDGNRTGWLHVAVDPNSNGVERHDDIVFRQGGATKVLRVGQAFFSEEDFCPLEVEIRSTSAPGWRGNAYLTLESASGRVFSKLKLENGIRNTMTVNVDPSELHVVWHSGGRTDRWAAYTLRNQYGETLLNVDNALEEGGAVTVMWPCTHVSVAERDEAEVVLTPNPTQGVLHVVADGLRRVEVMDMCGRVVMTTNGADLDMSALPKGLYMVRVSTERGTTVNKVVRL